MYTINGIIENILDALLADQQYFAPRMQLSLPVLPSARYCSLFLPQVFSRPSERDMCFRHDACPFDSVFVPIDR